MAEREEIEFDSDGTRCAAWLYRPEGDGPHPGVVLAHGFGGTRKGRLWAFAERFQAAGMAALVFDYRHFGDSAGEPRQLVSISRQLDDWHAALRLLRSQPDLDPGRIALWGTSFSGGHVVEVAAADGGIAAVVSQAPFANGLVTLAAAGPKESARLTVAGLLDGLAAVTGGAPLRIPIVNGPGKGGAMTQPGSREGYLSLFEDQRDFDNRVCARVMLTLATYAPDRQAPKVDCPLLVCVLADDAVTLAAPALRMAERAPRGESIDYGRGHGHFAIYTGDLFERAAADQTAFLARHLVLTEAPATA